jgi:hypothetical protein
MAGDRWLTNPALARGRLPPTFLFGGCHSGTLLQIISTDH